MKRMSKTTKAGATAAALLATSDVPGLPHWIALTLNLLAAAAIAWLGKVAAECPVNCPGTDSNGTRNLRTSRSILPTLALVPLSGIVLALSGCTTPNPQAGKGSPPGPAYIASPAINDWSNAVAPFATTAGAVTATGPLLPDLAAGAFAVVAALSGLWARHKSRVASTLADAVAAQGPEAIAAVNRATLPRTKAAAVRAETAAAVLRTRPPPPPSA